MHLQAGGLGVIKYIRLDGSWDSKLKTDIQR